MLAEGMRLPHFEGLLCGALQELHMTGCSLTTEALSVVVVEGGPKAHKRYSKLMLNRIKWDEDQEEEDDTKEDEDGVHLFHKACQ